MKKKKKLLFLVNRIFRVILDEEIVLKSDAADGGTGNKYEKGNGPNRKKGGKF